MLFTFLLVVQAIIAALLVTVILMQKSEGGGLTSSGSPSGLMSARGAADFLTRTTAILAGLFVGMSILLAVIAANQHSTRVDTSRARAPEPVATAPVVPNPGPAIGGNTAAPATQGNSTVPLGQ